MNKNRWEKSYKIIKNISKYFFCSSLVLLPDAESFAVLLHLFHLERGTDEPQSKNCSPQGDCKAHPHLKVHGDVSGYDGDCGDREHHNVHHRLWAVSLQSSG